MNTEIHHFKIGTFECIAVSDGTFIYAPPMFPPPAISLFGNAPEEQLKQRLFQYNIQPENWAERITPYICLVVNTGENCILVDTGAGNLGPNTGRLVNNLKGEGISPESIDYVILTHCHPDHIGGINLGEENLTFQNARYILWKKEWEFWMSDETEDKNDKHINEMLIKIARKKLLPIRDRIELIEHEGEILPGIQIVEAAGHTPGHIVVAFTSQKKQLLCIADTVLHPIHMEQPEWCATVDTAPEQLASTRRRILKKAAVENSLVLAYHFPFPGLGYVVQKGEAWQWQPI